MEVKSIHQLLFPYYLLHSKPYRHTVVQLFVLSCPPLPPRTREVGPPLSLHVDSSFMWVHAGKHNRHVDLARWAEGKSPCKQIYVGGGRTTM